MQAWRKIVTKVVEIDLLLGGQVGNRFRLEEGSKGRIIELLVALLFVRVVFCSKVRMTEDSAALANVAGVR